MARFEDDGVCRLQSQRAGLREGVRAGFEDDNEHAERTGDLFQHQALIKFSAVEHLADRGWQFCNLQHRSRHLSDLLFSESQSLERRGRDFAAGEHSVGCSKILRIRSDKLSSILFYQLGRNSYGGVALLWAA